MEITLVTPNYMCSKTFLQPPVELYTAQVLLEAYGHSVIVFDFRALYRDAFEAAAEISDTAKLIVVSVSPYDMTQMYHMDYRYRYTEHFTRILKAKHPSAIVFAEGAQCTLKPEIFLNNTKVDGVILWEIERTLVTLVEAIEHEKTLMDIPNLVLRGEDGLLTYNRVDEQFAHPDVEFFDYIPKWDQVDFTDYFGYDLKNGKHGRLNQWGVILGSRGCAFNCDFCFNFYKNHSRYRPVESVAKEMAMLSQKGLKRVFFLDMTFSQNRTWAIALCQQLTAQDNHLSWICQTRCDCIDEELLSVMKEAGCCAIEFGIESFSDDNLEYLNKRITTSQITKAISWCKTYGITASAFLMVGTPYETNSSIHATINMLKQDAIAFIPIMYTPRIGSKLGDDIAEKYNIQTWNDLLNLRGKLSMGYNMMDMIRDHSILKGESMGTVMTDFTNTELESVTSHHRSQFVNAALANSGQSLAEFVYNPDVKNSKNIVPFVSLPIVSACPFSCIYCGQGGENTISTLSTMKLETIMDIAVHLKRAGIHKIRLTGGEPLVHPEIGDIIRFLSESGFYVLINTNSLLVDDKIDSLMRTSTNIHFAVSLDTLDPKKFDRISRTSGNFAKVLRGINILKKLGYLMRINMVVGFFNVDEVDSMIDFCRKISCDLKLQEVASVPYPHQKWSEIHTDLSSFEKQLSQKASKVIVHEYARSFGIPVKVFDIDGVMVTLKAMNIGSRYDLGGICKECTHLPCHEGLYDVYILADGSIASCRWCRFGSLKTFSSDLTKAITCFQNAKYVGGHQLEQMDRHEIIGEGEIQRL